MADRLLDFLMRIRSDRAAANQAVQTVKAVRSELDKTSAAAKGFGAATSKGLSSVQGFAGSSAMKFGRSLSGLGAGEAGQIFMVLDDVNDALSIMGTSIAAVAPVAAVAAVGFGAAAIAIRNTNDQTKGLVSGIDAVLGRTRDYYATLATGSEEAIKAKQDEKRAELAAAEARLRDLEFARQGWENLNAQQQLLVDIGAGLGGFLNVEVYDSIRNAKIAYDDQVKAIDALKKEVADYGNITEDAGVQARLAAERMAAAEKELAKVRSDNALRAAQYEFERVKFEADALKLSSDAIFDRIASIEAERDATLATIASLTASGVQSEEVTKKIDDLARSLTALGQQSDYLASIQDQIAAQEEQKRITEETVDAVKQYNDDVTKVNDTFYKDQADALGRFNDAQVNAAQAAADAAEDALQKLTEQRSDLATDFARGEAEALTQAQANALQIQLDFQREEAASARQHANDLIDIQRDAQDREFDLALNRDFAGLFRSRRDTARAVDQANREYQRGRDERLIALQQENEDAARQYMLDRQQRQVEYQQRLVDAALQYQREREQIATNRARALNEARASYTRELQLAQSKYTQELTLRNSAAVAELNLIRQTGQARIALEQQIQNALLAQAQRMLASVNGARTTNFNQTNHITAGADPRAIAALVDQRTSHLLVATFD